MDTIKRDKRWTTRIGYLLDFEEERAKNPSPVWGLSTGFRDLDRITGGLHDGNVYMIGARPSVGKSALTLQIADHVATSLWKETLATGEHQGEVLIFSPEMTEDQILARLAGRRANVPTNDLFQGNVTEVQRKAWREKLEKLESLQDHLSIIAGESLDLSEIEDKVRNAPRGKYRLVIIDYLQRLHIRGRVSFEDQSIISTAVKDLANEKNIPIIALSQLSRDVEKRGRKRDYEPEPTMSDLRGTGRLEEDADVVILLHREFTDETGEEDPYDPTGIILKVEKNRHGPARRRFALTFIPGPGRFEDVDISI